mmetsp:Transcript_23229/g.46329  ORF Transcript_23229/g.46329 Transcript_23229/m.46329 type:complete len:370 (+) Transcript_23229:96-1205(+)
MYQIFEGSSFQSFPNFVKICNHILMLRSCRWSQIKVASNFLHGQIFLRTSSQKLENSQPFICSIQMVESVIINMNMSDSTSCKNIGYMSTMYQSPVQSVHQLFSSWQLNSCFVLVVLFDTVFISDGTVRFDGSVTLCMLQIGNQMIQRTSCQVNNSNTWIILSCDFVQGTNAILMLEAVANGFPLKSDDALTSRNIILSLMLKMTYILNCDMTSHFWVYGIKESFGSFRLLPSVFVGYIRKSCHARDCHPSDDDPVRPSAIKITGRGASSSGSSVQPVFAPEKKLESLSLGTECNPNPTKETTATAIVKIHRLVRDDDSWDFWVVGKRLFRPIAPPVMKGSDSISPSSSLNPFCLFRVCLSSLLFIFLR